MISILIIGLSTAIYQWWGLRSPVDATPIFQGVVYGCEHLHEHNHSGGLMHWVRVDLSAPGVAIYTTPLDKRAVSKGSEYTLRYVADAVSENHLAAAINGTLYNRGSIFPIPGTLARSAETAVSNHEVNHVDPNTYLLWFEDDRTPHLEPTKPPSEAALRRAVWGIGGNFVVIRDGVVNESTSDAKADHRTLVGVDPKQRLLWMAVFERATDRRAAQELANLGATDALELDGGSSSEMTIGADAKGVRPGNMLRTWIPTAVQFGVKAEGLK